MFRICIGLGVTVVALTAALVSVGKARSEPPPSPVATQRLIRLLQEDIDLKDVPEKLKLKDVLELISTHLTRLNMGKDVLVVVDLQAFKVDNAKSNSDEIYGEDVEIPAFPKKMPTAQLLQIALGSVRTGNATYLFRAGALEVTTVKQASLPALRQQMVSAVFNQRPLSEAIQELSDLTGASVVMDKRAGDELKTPVTATFRNDVSLGAALRMLVEMADLKLVVVEGSFYVTNQDRARAFEEGQSGPRMSKLRR
jgi:hypothetical protein